MLSSINKIATPALQNVQRAFYYKLPIQHQIVTVLALAALAALGLFLSIQFNFFGKKITPIKISEVTGEQKAEHAKGIKAFSFEMLNKITSQKDSKNVVISPLSISLVLSMIKHGLSVKDQTELEKVLHLPSDEKELQGCAFRLMDQLKAAGFDIANLVYLNNKYRLNPDFQNVVSQSYQSKVESGTSAKEINAWVQEVTHGQIKNIISQDELQLFFVALLNAIHFKAIWSKPFKTDRTVPGDFFVTPSNKVTVDLMADTKKVGYFENSQCQAFRLDYEKSDVSMILILPSPGFSVSSIDENLFDEIVKGLNSQDVKMTLPKFDLQHEINLIPLLQSMGVTNLFQKPDFSPLIDANHPPSLAVLKDLYVATVKQKSVLKIDEKTTEASTVTFVVVKSEASIPNEKPKEIHFNRPFMAALVQGKTPILFGLINNPKG